MIRWVLWIIVVNVNPPGGVIREDIYDHKHRTLEQCLQKQISLGIQVPKSGEIATFECRQVEII